VFILHKYLGARGGDYVWQKMCTEVKTPRTKQLQLSIAAELIGVCILRNHFAAPSWRKKLSRCWPWYFKNSTSSLRFFASSAARSAPRFSITSSLFRSSETCTSSSFLVPLKLLTASSSSARPCSAWSCFRTPNVILLSYCRHHNTHT